MQIPVFGITLIIQSFFCVSECKMKSLQINEGLQTRSPCPKCIKHSFLTAIHFLFSGSGFLPLQKNLTHETSWGWVLCSILHMEPLFWWKWRAGSALAAQGLTDGLQPLLSHPIGVFREPVEADTTHPAMLTSAFLIVKPVKRGSVSFPNSCSHL